MPWPNSNARLSIDIRLAHQINHLMVRIVSQVYGIRIASSCMDSEHDEKNYIF